MRKAMRIAPLLLLAAVTAQAGQTPYFGRSPRQTPKEESPPSRATVPGIAQGGETFGTAVVIPSIPYVDAGNTCSNVDDYYPSCAFAGISDAPDVVYVYRPTADVCVDMSMCNSGYDTILHVYGNDLSNLVACNDDDPNGDCGLRSVIEGVTLTAGVTYYFVVDGYSTACGEYILEIVECPPPCVVECPPGSTPEGEPICETNYEDTTNGGCNSVPPVFSNLPCNDLGTTVCATMGTYDYFGSQFRDTDWYQVVLTETQTITWCVTGEAPMLIAIIDGNGGCVDALPIVCFQFTDECTPVCCEATLPAGTYWVFAAPSVFAGVPCGSTYVATLRGHDCPPVSATAAQWSSVKSMYR